MREKLHGRHWILTAHVLDSLRLLPDASVSCCITSPPYFGLRAYSGEPQIWGEEWLGALGQEETPALFVKHLQEVFREVGRVLKPEGTLWLVLGDSYARDRQKGQHKPGQNGKQQYLWENGLRGRACGIDLKACNVQEKSLLGIPWRVAFALMDDGWILRSDIIFVKETPMPEPVKDRPVRAHEYIFLFAKQGKYYFDHEAIREKAVCQHPSGNGFKRPERQTYVDQNGARGQDASWQPTEWRNRRDVWVVPRSKWKSGHIAAFPESLVEPCLLAGCPPDGIVLDPFGGSGTVAAVAERHGRSSIFIDLDPACEEMVLARIDAEKGRKILAEFSTSDR